VVAPCSQWSLHDPIPHYGPNLADGRSRAYSPIPSPIGLHRIPLLGPEEPTVTWKQLRLTAGHFSRDQPTGDIVLSSQSKGFPPTPLRSGHHTFPVPKAAGLICPKARIPVITAKSPCLADAITDVDI
jgi:hypothetical protein